MHQIKLWIPDMIYHTLIHEAEIWRPLETGGSFMGYVATNTDVVITDAIDAGDNAKHTEHSFLPDQDYQLNEFQRIYYESNGSKLYLGDWHTHPNNLPNLSLQDKKTLVKSATTPESGNPNPIMMILGGKISEWIINAVQFQSGCIYLNTFFRCKYTKLTYEIY